LAQQGLLTAALAIPVPEVTDTVPVVRGQVLASRALVLAAADRLVEAEDAAAQAEASSRAVESIVLPVAVTAIASLRRGKASALDDVRALERAAIETGALDLLVTTYRVAPDVLNVLLRDRESSTRMRSLVRRVGDDDLLGPLGEAKTNGDAREQLTPREKEVHGLVCEGLSNRQIAAVLVISPATAKLHVQRVFDKLGVHSRKALAVHAALRRATQATSATNDSEDKDSAESPS
jgi:DNA-binding NarL/FixJ family response regulator